MSDFGDVGAPLGPLEIQRADATPLTRLSASAISMLLTCPEKFRLSYLLQRWPPGSGAMLLGNAYHHARRRNYEQKVWSAQDLPESDVLDAYDEGWTQRLGKEEVNWKSDDPAKLKDLGAAMVKGYHRKLSPLVLPFAVEERFEVEVPGVPLPLVGAADVIADLLDSKRAIIDTKTDQRGTTQPKPEWRVQALVYMAAYPEHDFAWHVQSKSGTLRLYSPERYPALLLRNSAGTQRTAQLLVQQAWAMLSDLYARYGLEQPWPGVALTHPYACKTCGHRPRCIWWAGS